MEYGTIFHIFLKYYPLYWIVCYYNSYINTATGPEKDNIVAIARLIHYYCYIFIINSFF